MFTYTSQANENLKGAVAYAAAHKHSPGLTVPPPMLLSCQLLWREIYACQVTGAAPPGRAHGHCKVETKSMAGECTAMSKEGVEEQFRRRQALPAANVGDLRDGAELGERTVAGGACMPQDANRVSCSCTGFRADMRRRRA